MTTSIESVVQSLSPGQRIELFQLDATLLGGDVYYFTNNVNNGQPVVFDGIVYAPVDLEASGFEYTGAGTLPTPHLKISNAASFLAAAVITLRDLVGATLIRIRTYNQFLDGGSMADPSVMMPVDIYRVSRKVNFNKVFIEWELASVLDQQGRKLPGRQVIKHNCTHTYRYYNTTTGLFEYGKATCPYVGDAFFDITDGPQPSASADVCGKLLSSCRLRFPNNQDKPFRGFPGAGER